MTLMWRPWVNDGPLRLLQSHVKGQHSSTTTATTTNTTSTTRRPNFFLYLFSSPRRPGGYLGRQRLYIYIPNLPIIFGSLGCYTQRKGQPREKEKKENMLPPAATGRELTVTYGACPAGPGWIGKGEEGWRMAKRMRYVDVDVEARLADADYGDERRWKA